MPEEIKDTHKASKAEKVVITFQDGHTESYDTFIVLGASGLTPVSKDGNNIVYMAEEDRLQTRAIAHVAAPPEVIAALVNSFSELLDNLLSHSSPKEALDIAEAILSIRAKSVEGHTEIRTQEIRPDRN